MFQHLRNQCRKLNFKCKDKHWHTNTPPTNLNARRSGSSGSRVSSTNLMWIRKKISDNGQRRKKHTQLILHLHFSTKVKGRQHPSLFSVISLVSPPKKNPSLSSGTYWTGNFPHFPPQQCIIYDLKYKTKHPPNNIPMLIPLHLNLRQVLDEALHLRLHPTVGG